MKFVVDTDKIFKILLYVALGFVIYMPLHVFIVQSASLLTGGITVWKAAKDVLIFALLPLMLYGVYRQRLLEDSRFVRLSGLAAAYVLLHTLFLLLDSDDHVRSTLAGMVFNLRLVAFLLLGVLVAQLGRHVRYLQYVATAVVLIASLVALFGVAQYFLPPDFLADFGYSKERGVPPLFFIDDKLDFPRVMSTLKDPNSFGAFLIVPILMSAYALLHNRINIQLFVRPFRRSVLVSMLSIQLLALFLTFSRGAALGLVVTGAVLGGLHFGPRLLTYIKRYWVIGVLGLVVIVCGSFAARDSYVFQNLVFHADESTVLADPNELRVQITQDRVEDVLEQPIGYGPGTAGLVSISNPKGTVLTENYFLQIAYEVGWLGLALFSAIISIIGYRLWSRRASHPIYSVLLASLAGYVFYSFFIHLWGNEAVALQWWLLAGMAIGIPSVSLTQHSDILH
jgi:hypothetical protein